MYLKFALNCWSEGTVCVILNLKPQRLESVHCKNQPWGDSIQQDFAHSTPVLILCQQNDTPSSSCACESNVFTVYFHVLILKLLQWFSHGTRLVISQWNKLTQNYQSINTTGHLPSKYQIKDFYYCS